MFLAAIESEVTLRAYIENYKPVFNLPSTFTRIHDDVTITIKGDIELEPSHKILYYDLDNAFDIKIERGSGEFSVNVNDSNVLRFTYDRANQKITVYPLSIGYAKIIVEDQKLISSQKAYCNVVVATAARIELSSESVLLQEEKTTRMNIKVFDSNNELFTHEQLRFMNVHLALDADTDTKSSGIRITPVPGQYDEFEVKGNRRGEYELVASAVVYKGRTGYGEVQAHKLFSNRLELHVFEKLEARPSRLLLAPGCLAAVQIVGGPSQKSRIINNVYLESRATSEKYIDIKTTDQSVFSVRAKTEGETEIVFEVKYRDGKVIGSVHVKATVALVNGVEILGVLDRNIHIGAQIRLIALTRLNNEYFTHSLCPFNYFWVSKNEGILQIDSAPIPSIPCHDQDGEVPAMDLTHYNIGVNATALSVGVADIELRVITKYPAPYYSNHEYTTVAKINVIDHLTHGIPTYIDKANAYPSLLLLPPNIDYQIKPHPHGSYRYSLCTQKQLNGFFVSDTGLISTTNEKGKATVLVEDTQVDTQAMMINVAVSNIYSIFIENSYKVRN